jgi:hypothetical protein
VFEENFDATAGADLPEAILVLDGQFRVVKEGGNGLLELPGSPLESYGLLFGPAAVSGREVQARIQGTRSGRKFPTFAAGLNGVNGYKIRVSPAKNAVELVQGNDLEVRATASYKWTSGEWARLRLQIVPAGTGVTVRAKVWQEATEPEAWTLTYDSPTAPPPGMAGVWGMPFSGTAIRFDDLKVLSVP